MMNFCLIGTKKKVKKLMLYQALTIFWRETALSIVLRDQETPKNPKECFLNPPCGCSNPGQELQCEDCPHLEACLSRFKSIRSSRSLIKVSASTQNTYKNL